MIAEARLEGEREEREKRKRPNAGRRREYRAAIWKRQAGKCLDCGCKMQLHLDASYPAPGMTLYRLKPEWEGGLYSLANLVGLCLPCVVARNGADGDDHGQESRRQAD